MAQEQKQPAGPDLTKGIAASDLADGQLLVGHVGEDEVLLARRGNTIFAVGAHCTHYHGPLGEGLLIGNTVRCPWHHACFDLHTGEAVRAPAFAALECWALEQREGKIFVRGKREQPRRTATPPASPDSIVIVGGGAAGFAAAEMLRREGYANRLIMLSDDDVAPVDRPNLSKDYLAGTAPEDWIPLRPPDFYDDNAIDLRCRTKVTAVDARTRTVTLADGESIAFDRLLLATGAEPVRLSLPGAERLLYLRTLADCRRIIKAAEGAGQAVVIGASFIGLEVAASLRNRGVSVHVVAPERRPLERILGPQFGDFIRTLHEEHGVVFHLEDTVSAINGKHVTLKSGATIEADLVVAGVGVKPRIELAEQSGLAVDKGVIVNIQLETSAPGIFAAGDIARWPDQVSGENARIEHWVVAERHGQVAARNMLGEAEPFTQPPFFWSQHYDVPINYVGYAATWDAIEVDGDINARDCLVRFKRNGKTLAVASIYRDVANLEAELAMERQVQAGA